MTRLRTSLVLGALVLTAVAPPAHGQSGNGLYEPFPGGSGPERAKRFVGDLHTAGGSGSINLSDKQLEAGVVVNDRTGKTRPAPALGGGPSDRAAGGDGLAPVAAWAGALALLGLLAAALRRLPPLAARRA